MFDDNKHDKRRNHCDRQALSNANTFLEKKNAAKFFMLKNKFCASALLMMPVTTQSQWKHQLNADILTRQSNNIYILYKTEVAVIVNFIALKIQDIFMLEVNSTLFLNNSQITILNIAKKMCHEFPQKKKVSAENELISRRYRRDIVLFIRLLTCSNHQIDQMTQMQVNYNRTQTRNGHYCFWPLMATSFRMCTKTKPQQKLNHGMKCVCVNWLLDQ